MNQLLTKCRPLTENYSQLAFQQSVALPSDRAMLWQRLGHLTYSEENSMLQSRVCAVLAWMAIAALPYAASYVQIAASFQTLARVAFMSQKKVCRWPAAVSLGSFLPLI